MAYINSLPIYSALEQGAISCLFELIYGNPSQMNGAIHHGEIDIGMISTIEFLRHQDDYIPLADLGIAGKRESRSVFLYVRGEIEDLDGKEIGVTDQSASSIQLLRLLCSWKWKIDCEFVSHSDLQKLQTYPAFLLIGDNALRHPQIPGFETIDLASAWFEATGFPMVFGMFVGRREVYKERKEEIDLCCQTLKESLSWGLGHMGLVSRLGAEISDLPVETLWDHFNVLKYQMENLEWQSVEMFGELSDLPLKPRLMLHA